MPVVNGKRYPYTQKGLDRANRAYSRLKSKEEAKVDPKSKKEEAEEIKRKFPRRKYLA